MYDKKLYMDILEKHGAKTDEKYGEDHGYAYDGPIVFERWGDKAFSKIKVLFIAKEAYGFDEDDICNIMNPDLFKASKTNKRIAKLSYCLQKFFSSKDYRIYDKSTTDDEIYVLINQIVYSKEIEDNDILRDAYSNISLIEIKKTSGRKKSNDQEIRKHSKENAPHIAEQIGFLNPDIIICCGSVAWLSLTKDTGIITKKIESKAPDAHSYNDMILSNNYHPSYSKYYIDDILFNIIYCSIKELKNSKVFANRCK